MRRAAHTLAIGLGALFLSGGLTPASAAWLSGGAGSGQQHSQIPSVSAPPRAKPIVDRLVELGTPRPQAELYVASLTDEDIDVLLANPDMIQRAAGTTMSNSDILLVITIALLVALLVVVAVD